MADVTLKGMYLKTTPFRQDFSHTVTMLIRAPLLKYSNKTKLANDKLASLTNKTALQLHDQ